MKENKMKIKEKMKVFMMKKMLKMMAKCMGGMNPEDKVNKSPKINQDISLIISDSSGE